MPICWSRSRRVLLAASVALGACAPDGVPTAPTDAQRVPRAPTLQVQPVQFAVTDLGSLGGAETYVDAINNLGQAVGWSSTGGAGRSAFIWSESSGMIGLPGLREGTGINDLGQVVGPMGSHARQFGRWASGVGTQVVELTGVQQNFGFSTTAPVPHDINNAGHVVGTYRLLSIPDFWDLAFVHGGVSSGDLSHLLEGGRVDRGMDVNNVGQVVGTIGFVIDHKAMLWKPASPRYAAVRLGIIGGPLGRTNNVAYSINDAGQVVGVVSASSTTHHAFLWTEGGGMVDLTPQEPGNTEARGINEAGQVVGYRVVSGLDRAFFWSAATGLVDLPTPAGAQSRAHAINNRGEIVGIITPAGGVQRAKLWKLDLGPANAAEAMADLAALVDGFASDGTLSRGEAQALNAKLATAAKHLDRQNSSAAAKALGAFVERIEALVQSGKLSAEAAQELTDAAEVALGFLQA